MAKLIVDYDLGSNYEQAKAQMAELRKHYPTAHVQFSQHAPEGYDGAYSVQVFERSGGDAQ